MDDKTLGAILIGIIYPILAVLSIIAAMFIAAYFLPERKRTSKNSFTHKISK